MNSRSPPCIPVLFPLFISSLYLFSTRISFAQSNPEDYYRSCGNKFSCGNITGIGYPFRGDTDHSYCGYPGLVLQCDGNESTTINIANQTYRVLDISTSTQTMRIAREDVIQWTCRRQLVDANLDFSLFQYVGNYINLTFLYDCPSSLNLPGLVPTTCAGVYMTFGAEGLGICKTSVEYPVFPMGIGNGGNVNATDIGLVLQEGFEIRWTVDDKACSDCTSSKGRCGYDFATNREACFCLNQPYVATTCPLTAGTSISPGSAPSRGKGGGSTLTNILLPIVAVMVAGVGLGWLIFYCCRRRKRLAVESNHLLTTDKKEPLPTPLAIKEPNTPPSIAFTKTIPSYPLSKSEFRRDTSYFGAKVFDYGELAEATQNFAKSRELGDGGFGAVYYGILSDGRRVAVKRLYENNYRRVEQFMNEVEILTRLQHSNLVKLYGCTSKRCRELLLVYEYVPNGTLADHLHGKHANSVLLSCPVRLNIAIETADALAYLHSSDIIHRDVKSSNILLDNDFHVKVADFGLSRLFPNDATHVSTAPQGTPGYVDPDYHQSYRLTEKSDVYSFGVVLIELISALPAVDLSRHRHDINLANMAINKIQNHTLHELVDQRLQFDANTSVRRMITLIGELAFRCLQQEKDARPSMQEVLDALRGIQSSGMNAPNLEVVHILVDGSGLLKDNKSPPSPNSVTDKWHSGSSKNCSG